MSTPDLNLLVTLDVLLEEGSVAGAARRLQLSPSAMSRALARLRETTGDPLLVRAGRGLVPTPRALELQGRVGQLVQDAQTVLRPAQAPDLTQLERTFTLRTSEGFVETFGPDLIARVHDAAPRVLLRFVQKPDKDSTPLRQAAIDLETGVIDETTGPEVRAQALFRDRLVGVVRLGHPLSSGAMTARRYAAGRHVGVSRQGLDRGPIDDTLETRRREARDRDVRRRLRDRRGRRPRERSDRDRPGAAYGGPPRPECRRSRSRWRRRTSSVSLLWHPRLDADPAHRWLRGCVRSCCGARVGSTRSTHSSTLA